METRTILHSDLNNFYASVECMLNPELWNQAVAVCGKTEERHGIVLAKNDVAKRYGIKTGETVWEAKNKCPRLVTVEPHYREYMKYSRLVRSIYDDYSDQVEAYGMDENWIDVTASARCFGDGGKIADEIRKRVKFELGLTVSVGVSYNKVFAKLGSDMKKPDAVTSITPDNFREKVWGLPAKDMLGVGSAASKELKRYGICTIGDLAHCSDELLMYKFGINGARMKRFANGEDTSVVMPRDYHIPIKSIGNGTTFLSDLHTNDEVLAMILALSDKVASRLRKAQKKARGISLTVKCCDLACKEWQGTLAYPTQNMGDIAHHCFSLFQQRYPWVKPVRALTIRAIRLVDPACGEQLSLFQDITQIKRKETLNQTIDEIRSRFGWNALKCAAALHLDKLPQNEDEVDLTMPTGLLLFA